MISKLYNARVCDGEDQINLIFSENEKKEITDKIKEYYRENGGTMPFNIDEYEVFMIGELGDPLLENQKDGIVIRIPICKSHTKYDLMVYEFKSVEAAVFAHLVDFASEYIAQLGFCDYDEFRGAFRQCIEVYGKYFPDEWVRELWRIYEESLESTKGGSLLDYHEVMPILEKFGVCLI